VAIRTYGIFWRWHFLAGAIACPIIFVVALTGAVYSFQPEIERAFRRDVVFVEPHGPRRGLDDIERALPADCVVTSYFFPSAPDHAIQVGCANGHDAMVDPYRATVLGRVEENALFSVILGLHWELLLGEPGRIAIEWATSWTVLLMLSGAYLWWPRGKTGGAWWPRRGPRIAPRQRLRDLHAVFGAYAIPCLLLIATTGLFWTAWAGQGRWNRLHGNAVAKTMDHPPTATMVAGTPRIRVQQALAASGLLASQRQRAVSMLLPTTPEAPFVFFGFDDNFEYPSRLAIVYVDAYSAARVRELYWKDLSAMGKVDRAGYSVHIGALIGLPGRILACVAAVILAALAVTGPWMWWKRRPRGKLGVPPRAQHVPIGLLALIAALGWLLPTVGWTLIAVLVYELARWLWQRRTRPPVSL